MFKGLILKDDNTIARVLDDIKEINESQNHILFGRGNSKLGSVDFSILNLIVTDDPREFKIGDKLPVDVVDKRSQVTKQSSEELVNSLGMEITKLKFEVMTLKGGTAL